MPLTLSHGFETELSDCGAENVTLKGDYVRQVVEILNVPVPTVLEVRFVCFFMSLSKILLQVSRSMSLCEPM